MRDYNPPFTTREEFDAVLHERDVSVRFDRVTRYVEEHFLGDADGKSVVTMNVVDYDEATNVTVFDEHGAEMNLSPDETREVSARVDAYMREHRPTYPDGPLTRRTQYDQ
jgi:hypothetical protein